MSAIAAMLALSIFGTAMNAAMNSSEAATNRGFQEDMMDKQIDNDWAMYEDAKRYNAPKAQVQRLRDAGLNPTLAMSNIGTGSVEGSPSVGLPSGSQASYDIGNRITTDLLSILGYKNEQKVLESQAHKLQMEGDLAEIDAKTRFMDNILKLHETLSKTDKNKADALLSRVTADATDFLSTAKYNEIASNIAKNASESEINWITYAKGLKELEFLPVQQRMSYMRDMAEIANMEANTKVQKQELLKKIQETNWTYFKSKGEKFVNLLNKKTEQFLIHERKMQPLRGMNPFSIVPALDYQFSY